MNPTNKRIRLTFIAAVTILFLLSLCATSIWIAHIYVDKAPPVVELPPATDTPGFKISVVNQNNFPVPSASLLRVKNSDYSYSRIYRADKFGQFSLPFVPTADDGAIISAQGYMAMALPSQIFSHLGSDGRISLSPTRQLRGRALDAAGSPVAAATIALIGPGGRADIMNGVLGESTDRPSQFQKTVTGADGRFELPQLSVDCRLVAYAQAGFAMLDGNEVEQRPDITLTPWGRIEGNLFTGGKPAANQEVECFLSNSVLLPLKPNLDFQCNVNTDANGHFVFDRVFPAEYEVGKVFTGKRTLTRLTQIQTATAISGQTVTVILGHTGRPVIGKLTVPPALNDSPDVWISGTAAGKPPATLPAVGSPPPRNFYLEIAPDWSFVINDVVPGNYTIHMHFNSRTGISPNASGTESFTMPPIAGGYSNEPLVIRDVDIKQN